MAMPLPFTQSKAACQIRVLVQYISDTRVPFAELTLIVAQNSIVAQPLRGSWVRPDPLPGEEEQA